MAQSVEAVWASTCRVLLDSTRWARLQPTWCIRNVPCRMLLGFHCLMVLALAQPIAVLAIYNTE